MKLYYAFSNIMILHQTNIQINVSHEEADLLVWSTQPIDYRLVEKVREKGVFRNVYYLERPLILPGRIREKIGNYWLKQKFYNEYLNKCLGDTKYDEFVTAGFWNDAIFVLRYLKKNNPKIKVGISEEGLLNYYCGKNHKNLYYMLTYGRRQRLKAFLFGGRVFKYAQKNIIADYLAAPPLLREKITNKVYAIPPIDENNPIMREIIEEVFSEYQKILEKGLFEEYRKRNIYYMITPHNQAYDPVDRSEDILEVIMKEVPLGNLILKTHTNATVQRKSFGKELGNDVFIDRNVYLLEILCSQIDMDSKVFIVRNSSIAIYLTQVFKVEPTFVFVHRLYSRYHYGMDDCGDYYVEDLKKNMKHPERVIVPNSYTELKVILHELGRRDWIEEEKAEDDEGNFKKFMKRLFEEYMEPDMGEDDI